MIVFVHGVPETSAIFDDVRSHLSRDTRALSLPGFGTPRPDGFSATKDAYAFWLIEQLEAIGEPVDLVGHDWGAPLTYRVIQTRPDLVRAWCADLANLIHPNYVWHDFAQLWRTPGAGEDFFANQQGVSLDDRTSFFVALGIPESAARAMASAGDLTMGGCILDLYRSASPNIAADWGPFVAATRPGLVVLGGDDTFDNEVLSREMARTLGAKVEVLSGLGHWWAAQDPARAARVLTEFFDSVEPTST